MDAKIRMKIKTFKSESAINLKALKERGREIINSIN